MKRISLIGVLLIAFGSIVIAYQGITYTTREKVVDLGSVEVTADKKRTIPLPPIMGGIAIAGGVALLILANKG